jgi:membrane protein YqaA with SNARE-associated domain
MGEQETVKTSTAPHLSKTRRRIISVVILIVILAGMVSVFLLRHRLGISQEIVERTGYPIIALLSFVGSASIFVPVPGILAVCLGGMLLSTPLVALVAGTAEALGELTGYAAGFGGRGLMDEGRMYRQLKTWMARRGAVVLFLLSVIPNPVFDVAGVAAGALRYPIWKFLLVIWSGKCIKSFGIAYSCASGVEWVLRFTNVS